jgi:hypothetical protein
MIGVAVGDEDRHDPLTGQRSGERRTYLDQHPLRVLQRVEV